jgi:hypothetical protein
MCTVILLHRPGHAWPLLLVANRDERLERPWDPPRAWWPDRPGVVAGRDRLADGTWMGINGAGVVATALNRPGSLGPAAGKRTRGVLPLLALEHATAGQGAEAIARLDAADWRPFNMVIADREAALFVRGDGRGRPEVERMAPFLVHMVTSHDPDDRTSPRVALHLPRFRAAVPPEPGSIAGWESWRRLLADTGGATAQQISIPPRDGYGTASAALLALPRAGAPEWWFAAGPPRAEGFRAVALA